jgi:hypothetical protein
MISQVKVKIGLRVFENRMLSTILVGPERKKLTGEQRKLRNGELHDLHSSPR